jgi:uncharacterized protein YmfQ (DUF2313 family)
VPDQHVRRSGDDYTEALAKLLPTGIAWPREPQSLLMRVVSGLAQYWGTVDSRAADLLEFESDPRETYELLPDWERNFGLPYPGMGDQIVSDRQKLLVKHMTLNGSPSRQFFEDLAQYFGFTVTISEHSNFICGVSRCGDTRPLNLDNPTKYRWEIGPVFNRFVWNVTALNSSAPLVEYLFQRFRPAHTAVVFNYYAISPIISPATDELVLSPTPPNIYFAIVSPRISPPSYPLTFTCYAPNAVLITRVKIIPEAFLNLTTTPPQYWHGGTRQPSQGNLALSRTAPTVSH